MINNGRELKLKLVRKSHFNSFIMSTYEVSKMGMILLLLVLCMYIKHSTAVAANYSYLSILPPGCDSAAALQCENEFLQCKLFNGPANDQDTLCNCARSFYGECLRLAGVSILNFLNRI